MHQLHFEFEKPKVWWLVNLPTRQTYPPPEKGFKALLRETNG